MTDRELLELAAKAAGIGKLDFDYPTREGCGMYFGPRLPVPDGIVMDVTYTYWNSLTNDGDALRLAVKLGIAVVYQRNAPPELGLPRECAVATSPSGRWFAETGRDENAATRRAIVRAAAEIGKAMK